MEIVPSSFWVKPFTMIDFLTRLFNLGMFPSFVKRSWTVSNLVELAKAVVAPNFDPLDVVLSSVSSNRKIFCCAA